VLLGLAEPAAVGPVRHPPIDVAAWPLLPAPQTRAIGVVGRPGPRLPQPTRWSPQGAGEARIRSLLSRIEMLVVCPGDGPLDGHGRTILEAMASGVPCILPPAFADTYGEAARYAAPAALRSAIETLRQDQATRATLVARGRAFAEACAAGVLTAGSPSP
jgi:glycosyltransferase involved in cell wall biosynthesis